jgi:hypothetical protein
LAGGREDALCGVARRAELTADVLVVTATHVAVSVQAPGVAVVTALTPGAAVRKAASSTVAR